MALQTLPSPLFYPGMLKNSTAAPNSGNSSTIVNDGTPRYVAYVFSAKEAMTVSHVGIMHGTVTASGALTLQMTTVDGSGVPSTLLGATNSAAVNTGALTSSTFTLHALAESATITKGQVFALKMLHQGGTSVQTRVWSSAASPAAYANFPYQITDVTGSAVKSGAGIKMVVFGSDATTFYQVDGTMPASSTSVSANAFSDSVAGAKRGAIFQVPFKCTASGAKVYAAASSGGFNAAIYDSGGAELSSSSTAWDADHSANGDGVAAHVMFDNDVTLSPGTDYRLVIEPTSATNCNMYTAAISSTIYRAAWPGGTNWFYTTFTTAGGWVDSATTSIPFIDLIITKLDDGVSSGGSRGGLIGG
jgi:hypothetical protein